MAQEKRSAGNPPPTGGAVQYGSEESVHAAEPGGRDTTDRTGQPPSDGKTSPAGARDAFTSSEVTERSAGKGTATSKTSA
jgi:hypothetical protein